MPEHHRLPAAAYYLRAVAETVVFVLAYLTVWPFASVDRYWEAAAAVGVALLALLWAANTAITRRFCCAIDGVTLALIGLLVLSIFQLIPLPLSAVRLVSPSAARLHENLRPSLGEQLPGEAQAGARSASIPLSVDPEATRNFAVRLAALFIVYAAVRNWVATRGALKRMAWAGMIVGSALGLLALGQFFSSPRYQMYWSINTPGNVFGPFINRNHYVDYIALCMGWTLALLLAQKPVGKSSQSAYGAGPLEFLTKPVALAAAIALGLMILSVLFCLSRGGLLSVFAAALALWFALLRPQGSRINRIYLLMFLIAIGTGTLYFGAEPLEERYQSAMATPGADDRVPLWRGALGQVPGFYLFGSGNGAFPRVEPLARPQSDQPFVEYTNAHNEYVEALIEGGLARFALTVGLVGVLVIGLGRAYRRRSERIVGPYLLGVWFGMFALIVHAFTDFGIHITAVGLLAAVSAGFAMAAGADADFGAQRHRKRKGSRTPEAAPVERAEPREKAKPMAELAFGGIAAIVAAVLVALAGLVIAFDTHNFSRADDYLYAAKRMGRPTEPALIERKIELLNTAVALRPNESTYHLELGKARLYAALDLAPLPFEAVAGAGAARFTPLDRLPPAWVAQYIVPGLNDLRTARDLSPLTPETHLLLGQFRQYFALAEPRLVYFERAKLLNKADPNIWYACGVELLAAGDADAACENWRRSLELSAQQLAPIIGATRKRWSAAEVQARILPDRPAILLRTAEMYADEPAARRVLLEATVANAGRPDWDWKQRIAIGKAAEALGRYDLAAEVWKSALEVAPEQYDVHHGAAEFYEREEHYDEALINLNWMIRLRPSDTALRDRALSARHGIDLLEKMKE